MSPAVVALALFAAILHAAWNAFLRSGGDRLWTITVMGLSGTAVALPSALLLPLPAPEAWPFIALSAALQVSYSLFLVWAYQHGELGQVYPIVRGSVPLLVTLGSLVVTGERPSSWQAMGVALVTLGIMSLTLGRGRPSPLAVLLALATGALIATYATVDATGVRLAGTSGGYTAWVLLAYGAVQPVAFMALRGRLRIDPRVRETWAALGGGLVAIVSYAAVVAAFALGPAGPIAALRETSVVFAALIGWLVLGEPLTTQRALACLVVAVGAVLIGR